MGDQKNSNPPSDGFCIDVQSVHDVELNIIMKHRSKTTEDEGLRFFRVEGLGFMD
jgi:hypothetical protein